MEVVGMTARLLLKGISDTSKKQFTSTGNRQIAVAVFWGLRKDRKLVIHLTVDWKEGRDRPTVQIIHGEEILEESSGGDSYV
jgi:hypothetical protein